MQTKDLLWLFAYYTLLHIAISPLAFGQQDPFEQQNHPQGDDLLAWVTSENGEPVAGLHAALEINRTVGFFSGSGTPPITSRTASNSKGELRFSNGSNWRDWIDFELTVQADNNQTSRKDFAEFTAFRWKLYGFWPQTTSRLELYSTDKPALWRNNEPISFVVPSLQKVRVLIKSRADNQPLANVRLQFRREKKTRMQDHVMYYGTQRSRSMDTRVPASSLLFTTRSFAICPIRNLHVMQSWTTQDSKQCAVADSGSMTIKLHFALAKSRPKSTN